MESSENLEDVCFLLMTLKNGKFEFEFKCE